MARCGDRVAEVYERDAGDDVTVPQCVRRDPAPTDVFVVTGARDPQQARRLGRCERRSCRCCLLRRWRSARLVRTRTRAHLTDQTRRQRASALAVEDRVEDRVEAPALSLSLTAGTAATLKQEFIRVAATGLHTRRCVMDAPVNMPLDRGAVRALVAAFTTSNRSRNGDGVRLRDVISGGRDEGPHVGSSTRVRVASLLRSEQTTCSASEHVAVDRLRRYGRAG